MYLLVCLSVTHSFFTPSSNINPFQAVVHYLYPLKTSSMGLINIGLKWIKEVSFSSLFPQQFAIAAKNPFLNQLFANTLFLKNYLYGYLLQSWKWNKIQITSFIIFKNILRCIAVEIWINSKVQLGPVRTFMIEGFFCKMFQHRYFTHSKERLWILNYYFLKVQNFWLCEV